MNIRKIIAEENAIRLLTDADGALKVRAYSPALREEVLLGEFDVQTQDGAALLPRMVNGRDGLYLRWSAECGGELLGGKKYVENLDFASRFDYDYPQADSIKGLQITMIQDAIELGVRHTAQNVCIGDLMRSAPGENRITYHFDGCDYYFDAERVHSFDARVKELSDHGIIVTLILLCSKGWATKTPEDMYDVLLHPGFLPHKDEPDVHLSAFNLTSDAGVRHYQAFIAFLTERYTDPSQKYGRAVGMIISNEINSQWIWGNAGLMPVEDYMREYTEAMRLAWQTAVSIYKNQRIYISLDHFWTGSQNKEEPLKYYGDKEVFTCLNQNCTEEGDFYWNVAFHPYPENLNYPDFWNDKTATDDFDTYRITFKNLRVLADFIKQDSYLYNGIRRRIILSEQGFNSHWTPESEVLQACAYGRAYRVCMEIPEIDSFILHAHTDNRYEFGLNLGLWRRKKDSSELDAPKPIYYVFKAIDHKDETGKYHWERY